jgi:hypothetical protein
MRIESSRAPLLAALVLSAASVHAGPADNRGASGQPEVVYALRSDVSPSLAEMLASAPPRQPSGVTEVPNIFLKPTPLDTRKPEWLGEISGVQESVEGLPPMPATLQSFNGLSLNGSLPPDTNGDVGPNHFVQWVNTQWNVYDKSTGVALGAPMEGNVFWTGFGGPCQTTDAGDPIVLFDDVAQRWVFSQFTGSTNPRQCFAISQTADPMGPYTRYEFAFPQFNDYPHIGIWLDNSGSRNGYYFVVHEFQGNAFRGAAFVGVDRERMLAGAPAAEVSMLRFPGLDAYGALPAHLEGTARARAGSCAPFVHFDSSSSEYLFWDLCADWDTPANSTLSTTPARVAASAPFSNAIGGSPQAGTSQLLDTFALNLMYRASARVFPPGAPTEVSMVVNHSVNTGGSQIGVRWAHFDLRVPGQAGEDILFANGFEPGPVPPAPPVLPAKSLVEDGVYAPGDDNRWMGGINIDRNGYLGMGYSVSSASLNPQIRYSGRRYDTPAGNLLDEGSCTAGIANGSQTSTSGRWGDYASMSTDPSDECTFWFTSEYLATTSSAGWTTRICSFRFPECGQPDFRVVPESQTRFQLCGATSSDPSVGFRVGVVSGQAGTATLSLINLAGVTPAFDSNPLVLPGSGSVSLGGATSLADGEYVGLLRAQADGKTRDMQISLGVSSVLAGAPNLTAPANNAQGQLVRPTLRWDATAGALSYRVQVATDANFTSIVFDQVTESTSVVTGSLQPNTGYFWRVRPLNYCGDGALSPVFQFSTGTPGTCPVGTSANEVFFDNNESPAIAWTTPVGVGANTWSRRAATGTGMSTQVWRANNTSNESSDQPLISPQITLPAAAQNPIQLTYRAFHVFEVDGTTGCWDGALLDISTDNGSSWSPVNGELLTDPYDGVSAGGTNPVGAGVPMWCRSQGGARVSVVDLSAFAGETIRLRYRSTSDDNTVGPTPNGFEIDDIRVFGCQ